jgi:hypothetical protein
MNGLEIAKHALYSKELTLAIVKNGRVMFETRFHRVSGFLGAIEQFGDEMEGASVADRVAGKAVALLCVYAKVKEVYAEILSKRAKAVFEENRISYEWKEIVDNVLDLNRSDVCPFEKAAESMSDPKDAYRTFKALQKTVKSCK